ncbi:MAG: hypothetical protein AUJ92_21855 [Armatimonadetes bacterium CG2_30_59_28]|nr:hypothetical protein [Armatimonadota bacterium]OIO89296.1 MAG: hypothetical protein AUJ92_21855 [Armatimonadetes bacterium CG2_30_59_28]PIU62682.1 MAG: hypothetical protein COS85_17775 [Armatimonadetes bacterium CG07_land_8_20_14_0_80_59_28]PIX46005.1 MAG: hypothetical protein COZ56_00505 [Armatimonadetes bacterium CG_4_8_14_3_um_filter_58_9]PIY41955.1 MAG: hypothetical protein COZ05_14800 [Armatimonadetes bacterium CG_4_10_14_3_um_filter_59_10]PJB63270.1 MAG: hypothetical protein CO095_168
MAALPAENLDFAAIESRPFDDDDDVVLTSIGFMDLRDIPRDQAKREIRELVQDNKVRYYSDIMQELRLDLKLVWELCTEMEAEGKLEEATDAGLL